MRIKSDLFFVEILIDFKLLLKKTIYIQYKEVKGNNRSVMPFRCSGLHARYTEYGNRFYKKSDSNFF